MCGNCKHFKPKDYISGLEPYGMCRHPCCPMRGKIRYDYSAACKYGETKEMH